MSRDGGERKKERKSQEEICVIAEKIMYGWKAKTLSEIVL